MSNWTLGFVLGGVVVLVVAGILIAILVVARKIETLAATLLEVAGGVESGTEPIGALGAVNATVENIVLTVRSVDRHVNGIAETLEGGGS